ncbi:MAG TPA: hypothetical protein P5150_06600 [Candidatus Ratteibacteria bacterium]|nr:hypothetical protein [Candidatus Ratteibacteria bacterium]
MRDKQYSVYIVVSSSDGYNGLIYSVRGFFLRGGIDNYQYYNRRGHHLARNLTQKLWSGKIKYQN